MKIEHEKLLSYLSARTSYPPIHPVDRSFFQVMATAKLAETMTEQAALSRASMLTMGAQAVMDAYMTILHLTAAVVIENLFNVLASAAFLQFILFAIFEMRLLLAIMGARRSANDATARTDLAAISCRFYTALIGGVFGMIWLQDYFKWVTLLLFSFWVPQIVFSARKNLRPPFTQQYVRVMSITRLALPLYIFGCPSNLLQV